MTGNQENGGGWHGSRGRKVTWAAAALIFVLPLVAMQFTDEVDWSAGDFGILGVLLVGSVFAFEIGARKTGNSAYRLAIGMGVVSAFLLFWINGAVGIIGSEDNDANMIYYGVLSIGLIGVIVARFKPRGMARAMYVTAGAQVLAFVIALVAGWGFTGPITMFFGAMWLGSARLFQQATKEMSTADAMTVG